MAYIDTNVIISYIDELDPNHAKAGELFKSIEGDKFVSRFTLIELASVYSRAGLKDPVALAIYSIKRINAKMVEADLNKVITQSLKLAPNLKLRTLDLLHISICHTAGIKRFVTFDKEIISNSKEIEKLNLRIMTM